jgi:hypothetical protein
MTLLSPQLVVRVDGIEVREAESIDDRIGRLSVLTRKYTEVGYLDGIPEMNLSMPIDVLFDVNGPGLLNNELRRSGKLEGFIDTGIVLHTDEGALYYDKYEPQSIGFVAQDIASQRYMGSARLILSEGKYQLPTLSAESIRIDEPYRCIAESAPAEFSQFAKDREANRYAVPAMFRAVVQHSLASGIDYWVATSDDNVMRLLNSRIFNFNLPKMGPSAFYLGSSSTPILIEYMNALANGSSKSSSEKMCKFILGETDSL